MCIYSQAISLRLRLPLLTSAFIYASETGFASWLNKVACSVSFWVVFFVVVVVFPSITIPENIFSSVLVITLPIFL